MPDKLLSRERYDEYPVNVTTKLFGERTMRRGAIAS
jgi:hypothetical protein